MLHRKVILNYYVLHILGHYQAFIILLVEEF